MSASASNPSLSPSQAGGSSSGGGSSNGNGGNCGGGGTVTVHQTGPCGACKFLRRKCHVGCIFAPYFDADQGAAYFAAVHKVFGASNVSKLLHQIPHQRRLDAVVTICYEAQARLKDPVYGIVSQIFGLQQQVINLQSELTYLQGHLTQLQLSPPIQPPPPPPQPPLTVVPPPLTISDLPSPSSVPNNYDLSSLFDQMGSQSSASWAMQPPYQANDPRLYGRGGGGSSLFSGHHDLQTIAQEFMNCQCTSHHLSPSSSVPRTEASPSSSSPGLSG